jgi:hypothetical protein
MEGTISAESYPTSIRGTCYGLSAALGKTGAAVGTQCFTPIQSTSSSRHSHSRTTPLSSSSSGTRRRHLPSLLFLPGRRLNPPDPAQTPSASATPSSSPHAAVPSASSSPSFSSRTRARTGSRRKTRSGGSTSSNTAMAISSWAMDPRERSLPLATRRSRSWNLRSERGVEARGGRQELWRVGSEGLRRERDFN